MDPNSPWEPDTGVPVILAYPDDPSRYLMMERAYVDGAGYKVLIFDATTRPPRTSGASIPLPRPKSGRCPRR
ncbi:hypothetical protein [Actinokineospora sp.]|uniref:hypothetical protein n=1 Tax=Actinokineospora sp. TaxID=1872133 RepID=UPI003D6C484A